MPKHRASEGQPSFSGTAPSGEPTAENQSSTCGKYIFKQAVRRLPYRTFSCTNFRRPSTRTEEYGSALNPDAAGAAFLDGALTESHQKDHSWRADDVRSLAGVGRRKGPRPALVRPMLLPEFQLPIQIR